MRALFPETYSPKPASSGFTLIETLVAITLLTVAIVAPMTLTVQSLSGAYYARDEITAENLAQEGLEAVRALRDENIISLARGNATPLFNGIPIDQEFTVDEHTIPESLTACAAATCSAAESALYTDGEFYGGQQSGWTPTSFRRSVLASKVQNGAGGDEEIRVSVTVSWQTGSYQRQSVVLTEDLYKWEST